MSFNFEKNSSVDTERLAMEMKSAKEKAEKLESMIKDYEEEKKKQEESVTKIGKISQMCIEIDQPRSAYEFMAKILINATVTAGMTVFFIHLYNNYQKRKDNGQIK